MRTPSTTTVGRLVIRAAALLAVISFAGNLPADQTPPFAMAKKVKSPRDGALIRRLIQNPNKVAEAKPVKRAKDSESAQIFVKAKPIVQPEKSELPTNRYSKTIVNWSEDRLLIPVTPSAESTKLPAPL